MKNLSVLLILFLCIFIETPAMSDPDQNINGGDIVGHSDDKLPLLDFQKVLSEETLKVKIVMAKKEFIMMGYEVLGYLTSIDSQEMKILHGRFYQGLHEVISDPNTVGFVPKLKQDHWLLENEKNEIRMIAKRDPDTSVIKVDLSLWEMLDHRNKLALAFRMYILQAGLCVNNELASFITVSFMREAEKLENSK